MDSQPRSRPTSWGVTALGGGLGIAGAGFAVFAFAARTRHFVFSARTLYAIVGLLLLFGIIVTALVKRLARSGAEPTAIQSTEPNEAEGLTRRVRLLRGTDDL